MKATRVRKTRRAFTCALCGTRVQVGQPAGLIEEHGHTRWAHVRCILSRQQAARRKVPA